jgi:hypothetical protein
LAVSWQVFEHIRHLNAAFDNLHAYLKPGGSLISLFSGRWSAFGIINRLIPNAVESRVVERSMGRQATNRPIFPAHYDRCTYSALSKMTTRWSDVEIHPLFRAATYFHYSRLLPRMYVAYENAVCRAPDRPCYTTSSSLGGSDGMSREANHGQPTLTAR